MFSSLLKTFLFPIKVFFRHFPDFEVFSRSFLQGSRDNMSIIIIAFPAAPKVDPEAQRKDEELNKVLQQKVAGNF